MILRIFFLFLVIIAAVVLPTWLFAVCAALYALRYTAYELLFIACAIDAFYGSGGFAVPYYTFFMALLLVIVEWLKPRLSVYNYEQ